MQRNATPWFPGQPAARLPFVPSVAPALTIQFQSSCLATGCFAATAPSVSISAAFVDVDIDTDGYVHVLGRLTDLIIRGGANVSPAEVESAIASHPDIAEVAVVGLPDPDYGERVVAAIVLRPGGEFDAETLRAHCATALAGYKVPSRFVVVEELPHNTSTGKVHRREVARLVVEANVPAVGPT